MTVRYSTGCLNKLLGENGVDTGADGLRGIFKDCVIDIYSGGQPATANAAVTGTLLGRVTLDGGAFTEGVATNGLEFDAPVSGVLSKAAAETWRFTGLANGVAGWFRLRGNAVDSGALSTTLPRIDGSIGSTSGDMLLSNVNITTGAPSTIDVFNITLS